MPVLIFLFIILSSVLTFPQQYPKYEVRGAWIATVANIDWPSSNMLSSGEKIFELVEILDKLKTAGINTVFFQIRTECDALYNSAYEPWSYWLTGEQGRMPDPYFDPLAFAVDEAHLRGMELHAWFNPYRAVKNDGEYQVSRDHITVTHPEWILTFDKYKILDPGIPEVNEYITKIVKDVVSRYDIDGVHFDDYFYPYTPITDEDKNTYKKYGFNFNNIDDWRRNNVNSLIKNIYDSITFLKPEIKFGVSPFGIIENKYAGTKGFESYNILYNDPLTWIKEKTIDYLVPQLYWEIGHKAADYSKLLPWWSELARDFQLYIGHFSSRIMAPGYKGSLDEIGRQIRMSKKYSNISGSVFFSAVSIAKNYSSFTDTLKKFYRYKALIPPMEWKDNTPPLPPEILSVEKSNSGRKIIWQKPNPAGDGDTAYYYVVYKFSAEEKFDLNNPVFILEKVFNCITEYFDESIINEDEKINYAVTAVDRSHNESILSNIVSFSSKK